MLILNVNVQSELASLVEEYYGIALSTVTREIAFFLLQQVTASSFYEGTLFCDVFRFVDWLQSHTNTYRIILPLVTMDQ